MVEYFDRSFIGYIPTVQIYCQEAHLPALLANYQQATVPLLSNYQQATASLLSNYQQATVPLLSNYQQATAIELYIIYKQVTVPKGAIVARTGLRCRHSFT